MVERLIRALYSPSNVFCIHYDQKSPAVFRSAMEGIARCLPNVFIASKREYVIYAGFTRLKADINCLSDLLEVDVPWKYVINLCGQDFPLKANMELVSELAGLNGANMLDTYRPNKSKKQRFSLHYEQKDWICLLAAPTSCSHVIRRKDTKDPDETLRNLTADYSHFLQVRGYEDVCATEKERHFHLAYSLVVHKYAWMVERLIRALYSPSNVFCIHYDQKSPAVFRSAMEGIARCLPNVFIASKREYVIYAGFTHLKADINCLSDLLEVDVPWKYVINLCGQDFSLKTNMELVSELAGLNGANMLDTYRPNKSKKQRFSLHFEQKDWMSPKRTNLAKSAQPHGIEMFTGSAYFVLSRDQKEGHEGPG
ncbi:beta-1,3-galactosyl-O-glycosyl-glycoprotein beta-1,6-N-acetylglucosaminyltransferase 4-like [Nerophis lumbriciformis]|uniref:beta-1,3-galactosyl-O-glycosyl-glycoprotein beta-1,6-N-acetylglucosaminyltransferase 4-like n=1 Tax=Nerophis lumbriciformis TaxID=546530 RepID=UPI002ADF69E5|nr:beta-1,3-galactosyl-O-glycosyl-glycoprotein beta-1,6-N-acetylglucosaminyltransferase 4-like [Nerophis lumbriciformis]